MTRETGVKNSLGVARSGTPEPEQARRDCVDNMSPVAKVQIRRQSILRRVEFLDKLPYRGVGLGKQALLWNCWLGLSD